MTRRSLLDRVCHGIGSRQRGLVARSLGATLFTRSLRHTRSQGCSRSLTGAVSLALAATIVLPAAAAANTATVPQALHAYLRADRTDLQWSLAATHAQAAWTASTGAGVIVATVDTGADPTSADLAGQLLPGAHLDPATDTIVAGSVADLLGHGTHVAGIIAAKADGFGTTGIAPDAKVLPVNINTGDGSLSGDEVAAGIAWAQTHGANVINLSLGLVDTAGGAAGAAAICAAVTDAVAHNVVVVAAAGNDGLGTNLQQAPGFCPGAISVAALDATLHPAPWSSFDGTVTLAAPGDNIYSTVPVSTSPLGYGADSGTSMAAPFVAGVAALILSQHPLWTPAQVSARLTATASDLSPTGVDPRTGAGVVDPAAAVGVAAPPPAPVPSLAVQAEPFASHLDSLGQPVFDRVLVHWAPDPTAVITGYQITRWTTSGQFISTVPAGTVRIVLPADPAGYTVTATSGAGDIHGLPVWFPVSGQDFTPVSAVTGLRAHWVGAGDLAVSWVNPPANAGLADQYTVSLNGVAVATGRQPAAVPSAVRVAAATVPPGDLIVTVLVGSSVSLDVEQTQLVIAARVPFSGAALRAGTTRYRIDLVLADSRRAACGRPRCTGTRIYLTLGRHRYLSYLDSAGHAVVVVNAPHGRRSLAVAVTVPRRVQLSQPGVTVAVA